MTMNHTDPQLVTIGNRLAWRDPATGRTVPYVAGGAVEDPPADPPTDPPADPPADQPKLTQAEVDAIVQRRLAEQKRKLDADAKDAADRAKAEAERAAMDEADRLKAEAADAKAEADRERAEAAAERLTAKIERRLLAAGVPDSALARAVRLVQLDPDATDDDITAEIDAVRADVPALFEPAKTDDSAKPPAGGTPPPPPKGGQGQPTKNEQARELLRARGLTPRSEAA